METAATKPFEPKGDRAEWEMLYDYLRPLKKGTLATYQQMANVLGRSVRKDRAPIYRAMRQLEKQDSRSLMNVRGAGYRITVAQEHEALAAGHHIRAQRQVAKAVQKITSADRSQLTRDEKTRFTNMELALKQHQDILRRLSARVKVVEEKQKVQGDTAAKLDRLMTALERHGISI